MPPAPEIPALNRRTFLSLLAVSSACPGLSALHGQEQSDRVKGPRRATDNARTERRFVESEEMFANPDRGFYAQRRSDRMDRLETLRDQGISLLLVTLDLREFRDTGLSTAKLAELRRALALSRDGGYKVIFRAAYGFTDHDYRVDPKDLSLIVGHIRQIGAVLTESRDIIFGVQAGMLGPWGEWHGSNHGDPPSLESRRAVLFAWLDSVPDPITVHVRRPMFIRDIFAAEPGGFNLAPKAAFNGSRLSRTGWHNDAFLVPPSDYGTYAERGWDRARELEWCNHHGRFTPFGGETVHTATPLPIAAVVRELELLHATYLNIGYHPRVLQLWRETEYLGGNAFQHIARRLGYRFVARRLDYPSAIRPGETFTFHLTLINAGFASAYVQRVVEAALFSSGSDEPASRIEILSTDVRRWSPEAGEIHVSGVVPVPRNFPRGRCQLAIRIADPSARLRNDSRYAIRLANDGIPFTTGGWNTLADDTVC